MIIKRCSHSLLFFILLIVLFLLSKHIARQINIPQITISKQEKALNYKSHLLRYASLGNIRFCAGLLWIQTLLESDLEHYKSQDLNSWMFLRFKTITELDPRFYEAYLYGGQYLSVVKDDPLGAREIYKRGLKLFSNDYLLNYYSAFNDYFELGDLTSALFHYNKILHHPKAPTYFPSLIAKLKSRKGDLNAALKLIQTAYTNAQEGTAIKEHFKRSLYKIRAEVDLKCLNSSNNGHCNKKDLFGNPYPQNTKGAYIKPLL